MVPKPLKILEKGLSKISEIIKECKNTLNAKLSQKESILLVDEHWLDHEGNTSLMTLRQPQTMKEGLQNLMMLEI
jgi:hypothetical protein